MGYSLSDSSVHGLFQARVLEWVAISSSRGSSWSDNRTHISCLFCIAVGFFPSEAMGKPILSLSLNNWCRLSLDLARNKLDCLVKLSVNSACQGSPSVGLAACFLIAANPGTLGWGWREVKGCAFFPRTSWQLCSYPSEVGGATVGHWTVSSFTLVSGTFSQILVICYCLK